jgi:hypothetical protein
MADEIETLDELIERAELRDVVVHSVVANREGGPDPEAFDLPPDELHAPESPDETAALQLDTRLHDHQLEVDCQVQTRNAHGSFQVKAEAVFSLPAPVSVRNIHIVGQFVEKVGAPALFPYIRATVASLAAQLSVPAAPLPLLRPGDVALGIEAPAASPVPDGVAMQGTVEITGEDGSKKQVLEFFYDAETGEIVRLGDDDASPEFHALLDSLAEIGPLQNLTAEWLVRNHGEEHARKVAEHIRTTEGDAAGEVAMAEIDEAVQTLAMEAAATNLGEALEALHTMIAATKERVAGPVSKGGIDEREALTALLIAAERVMYELDEFRTTAS